MTVFRSFVNAFITRTLGIVSASIEEIDAERRHMRIYLGPSTLPNRLPTNTTIGTGMSEKSASRQLIINIMTISPTSVNA